MHEDVAISGIEAFCGPLGGNNWCYLYPMHTFHLLFAIMLENILKVEVTFSFIMLKILVRHHISAEAGGLLRKPIAIIHSNLDSGLSTELKTPWSLLELKKGMCPSWIFQNFSILLIHAIFLAYFPCIY